MHKKTLQLILVLVAATALLYGCEENTNEAGAATREQEVKDSLAREAMEKAEEDTLISHTKIIAGIDPELMIKYQGGNFYNHGQYPHLYYNPNDNQYMISFGKIFRSGKLGKPDKLADDFNGLCKTHKIIYYEGKQKQKKVTIDGKEYVVMALNEIIRQEPEEEKAKFTNEQWYALQHTAGVKYYTLLSKNNKVFAWGSGFASMVCYNGTIKEFSKDSAAFALSYLTRCLTEAKSKAAN